MNTQIADAPAVTARNSGDTAHLFVAILLGVLLLLLPLFGYGPFRTCAATSAASASPAATSVSPAVAEALKPPAVIEAPPATPAE
ncbi:MAG: hypothetical protein K2Q06_01885, partial [Parvularculaceae bacterium]|nr:hypothetical protein [Parvularculaceae bacterium]